MGLGRSVYGGSGKTDAAGSVQEAEEEVGQ